MRRTKGNAIIVLSAMAAMLCFTACSTSSNEGEKKAAIELHRSFVPNSDFQIIVDEDSLVEYIWYGSYQSAVGSPDCSTVGLSPRLKADGTPYTIEREDLDKYTHFSFKDKEGDE